MSTLAISRTYTGKHSPRARFVTELPRSPADLPGCCAPYFAEGFPVPVDFPRDNGVNLPAKEIFPRSFRVTGTQDDRGPVLWPTCALAAPRRLRSRGATGVNVYLMRCGWLDPLDAAAVLLGTGPSGGRGVFRR